jgi:hypothetical protein
VEARASHSSLVSDAARARLIDHRKKSTKSEHAVRALVAPLR